MTTDEVNVLRNMLEIRTIEINQEERLTEIYAQQASCDALADPNDSEIEELRNDTAPNLEVVKAFLARRRLRVFAQRTDKY